MGFGLGRRSMHDSGILLYHFRVYGWAQAESEVGLHTSATRVERNAEARGAYENSRHGERPGSSNS